MQAIGHPPPANHAPRRRDSEWKADVRDVKVRDALRRLQDHGWYIDRTRGSHRQLKHPTKPGAVTVSGKPSVDVPPGTLQNIWRQAGLREER